MRKWCVAAALVAVFTGVGFGTVAIASAASKGAVPAGPQVGKRVASNGLVKASSQWTLYDLTFEGSPNLFGYGPCEVLSFQSHGTFTGDKGDVGRWKSNIKLTFTNNTFFPNGTYAGKYESNVTAFQGDDETGQAWAGVGPLRLIAGNDPVHVGTC